VEYDLCRSLFRILYGLRPSQPFIFPDAEPGLGLGYGRRSQPFDLTPAYATRITVSFSQIRK
jgi:hypothetical protein